MKLLKLILCCMVSILCLFLVFKKVNLTELKISLINIKFSWIILATIFGVLKIWIICFRWQLLEQDYNNTNLIRSFYFYTIGTMTNMTLPFRMGDFIRARLIAKDGKKSYTIILAIIAREHVIDLIILCCMTFCCVALYSLELPKKNIILALIFLIGILAILTLIFFVGKSKVTDRIENMFVVRKMPRCLFVLNIFKDFVESFFKLGGLKSFFKILGYSGIIWILQGLWVYSLLCASGLADIYFLGFDSVIVLMTMMGLTMLIPASPGYVGSFHLMVTLSLVPFGVPKTQALSYAILAHLHSLLFICTIGIYSFWKINFKIKDNFINFNKYKKVNQYAR